MPDTAPELPQSFGDPKASPAERRLAAQVAAHHSWAATTDRSARTAKGRAALDAKFLDEADGDPAKAESLRRAHFARLSLAAARARTQRAGGAA